MFAKRGFSTIELLTVAAILITVMALWYFVFMQTSSTSRDLQDEQSFHSLSSGLVAELRRDIRCSLSISSTVPNRWEIETISTDQTCLPYKETIVYELSSDQLKVYVTRKGKVKTYDFSEATNGKKITFSILP